jgi:hypothetical protein
MGEGKWQLEIRRSVFPKMTEHEEKELRENTEPATMGHLTISMRAINESLRALSRRYDEMSGQLNRLMLVPAKLAQMESQPRLHYAGTWNDHKEFPAGALLTDQGSLWYTHSDARRGDRPGRSKNFQLICKRGQA